jgi:AP-2 complex subunit alpha
VFDDDIFGVASNGAAAPPAATGGPATPEVVHDHVLKFLTKDSGVLYESDVLQIGIKMEFRKSLSRVQLFYGNKSHQSIGAFSSTIASTAELEVTEKQPVPSLVNVGEQIVQIFNIQCNKDFSEYPILTVTGTLMNLRITLPVFITKFVEPAQMDAATFFNRWRALAKPEQESQSIFTAQSGIDKSTAAALLSSTGLTVLDGVDPNHENHVA